MSHPPTNLPTPLTSFIGREQELAEATALLGESRLLTLTGPGGTGKTRLALAAARQAVVNYPDGVWFVDLSGVSDAAGVLPAIAQVLGVVESEGRSLAVSLAAYLRHKRLLLVLDNFEQVIEAALPVSDLLMEAPALTALVTSRTLLRVPGEHEYAVPPLPLPEAGAGTPPTQLRHNPAVQLFAERARALRPDFSLTPENTAVVAAICDRLEGLPLALELAAARVKLLPPEALLSRLDRRLSLLSAGERGRPARQQTLRAAIQWSWDLLSEPEQTLFRRLSVFAGGWTLEAAEAVCDLNGGLDVLTGIESLVDKSLVRQPAVSGEPRFTMLATLQELAHEQLEAAGETDDLGRRHAEYFCAMAERADAAFFRRGRVQEDILRPLDPERDNCTAALQWTLEQQETEFGLRLAGALQEWFFLRVPSEGRRWADAMLSLPEADAYPRARGKTLWTAAGGCVGMGEWQDAVGYMERAAADFRTADDVPSLSRDLALWACYVPDAGASRTMGEEALALARATDEPLTVAYADLCLGITAAFQRHDPAAARMHLEAALQVARALDADHVRALMATYLAELLQLQGLHAEARPLWQEALPLVESIGDRFHGGQALAYLALLASADGDWTLAASQWLRQLLVARELGSMPLTVAGLAGVAEVLTAGGRPRMAAVLLGAIDTIWRGEEQPEFYQQLVSAAGDPALTSARAALDPDAFARAWAEGQALSLEEATELALAALASVANGS